MQKYGIRYWKWPDSPDLLWYKKEDIVIKINEATVVNTRGALSVPEMNQFLT